MTETARATVLPLEPGDPPMVGRVLVRGRLGASDAGIVYAGQLGDEPVAVVVLTAGAETDSFGRARFERAVDALASSDPAAVLAQETDHNIAAWAVVPASNWQVGLDSANRLLAPVTLADVNPVGTASGPDYRPHWLRRVGIGRWRLWPLPWPADLRSAARWTMLAALALMIALAALALWIVFRVFDNTQLREPPGQPDNPLTSPVPQPSVPPTSSQPPTSSAIPTTGPQQTTRLPASTGKPPPAV